MLRNTWCTLDSVPRAGRPQYMQFIHNHSKWDASRREIACTNPIGARIRGSTSGCLLTWFTCSARTCLLKPHVQYVCGQFAGPGWIKSSYMHTWLFMCPLVLCLARLWHRLDDCC